MWESAVISPFILNFGARWLVSGVLDAQAALLPGIELKILINLLKPNDVYICRTTALISRRYILNIYSTNIHTEYFKHAA